MYDPGGTVIHRDRKPSNTRVEGHDGVPVVEVTDFGVAKAVGRQRTDKTIHSRFVRLIGTPLDISPEQSVDNAVDVGTRGDVESLGVVPYEGMTGTTPFERERFVTAAEDEIRRICKDEEPPKPRTRRRAAAHRSRESRPSVGRSRPTSRHSFGSLTVTQLTDGTAREARTTRRSLGWSGSRQTHWPDGCQPSGLSSRRP